MDNKQKCYKGEKYIYLLMGYKLAKAEVLDRFVKIGNDSGMKGGQNYERIFSIQKYNNKILLIERKVSSACADYSRTFEIVNEDSDRPSICDYMNEDNENCGQTWTH